MVRILAKVRILAFSIQICYNAAYDYL
jgi:hypothetical protein